MKFDNVGRPTAVNAQLQRTHSVIITHNSFLSFTCLQILSHTLSLSLRNLNCSSNKQQIPERYFSKAADLVFEAKSREWRRRMLSFWKKVKNWYWPAFYAAFEIGYITFHICSCYWYQKVGEMTYMSRQISLQFFYGANLCLHLYPRLHIFMQLI